MRVLITGGAGYIGSTVTMRLLKSGHHVTVIDNLSREKHNYLINYEDNPRFNFHIVDICSLRNLMNISKKNGRIDAIVHLAAIPGMKRCQKAPKKAVSTNVYGTHNVLQVARKWDIEKVIFSSTAAVYGNPIESPIEESHPLKPINIYGVTKLAGEKLLEAFNQSYGLKTVSLRFGNVYGVGLYTRWETVIPLFIKKAFENQILTVYDDGHQTRDFIHVLDLTQAISLVLETGEGGAEGEVYNVGTGKAISINEVADEVLKVFKTRFERGVKIVHLPPRIGEPHTQDFRFSISKFVDKFDFKPAWSLSKGIEQLVEHYSKSSQ